MADAQDFINRSKVLDVQFTALGQGASYDSPVTGSTNNGTSYAEITPHTIGQTSANPGELRELTELYVIPPVAYDGSYPDVDITLYVDGNPVPFLHIDGNANTNMAPLQDNTVRIKKFEIGHPVRWVMNNQHKYGNIPTAITGLKYGDKIQVQAYSKTGWGTGGNTAITPLRVIGYGDILNDQALGQINSVNVIKSLGTIGLNYPGITATELLLTHAMEHFGGFNASNWTSLPGGTAQQGMQVFRAWNYAQNQVATGSNDFVFTTNNNLGGGQNNIDNGHDLGYSYTQKNDIFIVKEFGVRLLASGLEAYAGLKVNGVKEPIGGQNGQYITSNDNQFRYGLVPSSRAAGTYYSVPSAAERVGQIMAYKNGLVPFVSSNGLTALSANQVSVALGGIQIKNAQ